MESVVDLNAARVAVDALLDPRNVAIVGANDRPGSWSQRTFENLNQYGFPGALYPVNPKRTEIWGVPCFPDLAALPESPDHLAVLVPPDGVADVLREGARLGARSATIFTAGIGELHDEHGLAVLAAVQAAIRETGLAVSGPNCMGNLCARTRMVTLNDSRSLPVVRGPVAMVGQSGGVMLFTAHALHDRGIDIGYVITSGNELGLTTADYIAAFAADPEVEVIVSYIEGVRDPAAFRAACAAAQSAGKRVVVLKLGRSAAGRAAALAHTGALAGRVDVFDAVAGEFGVIRVESADDIVETVELLLHARHLGGRRLAALTLSGAFRGMLIDAADQNGLEFATLSAHTQGTLAKLLGTHGSVNNPVDGAFPILTSEETYLACIQALQADPGVDLVLAQEELSREPMPTRPVRYMQRVNELLATGRHKPFSYVSFVSYGQTEFSRDLRRRLPHVAIMQEVSNAMRAVAKVVRVTELEHLARTPDATCPNELIDSIKRRITDGASPSGQNALDEAVSKEIIRAYGIPTLPEAFVTDLASLEAAARKFAVPVVVKAVGPRLVHKSDVGAVALDLQTAGQRHDAFERITANVAAHRAGPIEGFLVAPYVKGGVEIALGMIRDPEVGPALMVGFGGVMLELIADVAFGAPPMTPAKASDMIRRTRLPKLLAGFRGGAVYHEQPLIDALVALGRLVTDLADVVDAVDINPFLLLPRGGAVALDALIVARTATAVPAIS